MPNTCTGVSGAVNATCSVPAAGDFVTGAGLMTACQSIENDLKSFDSIIHVTADHLATLTSGVTLTGTTTGPALAGNWRTGLAVITGQGSTGAGTTLAGYWVAAASFDWVAAAGASLGGTWATKTSTNWSWGANNVVTAGAGSAFFWTSSAHTHTHGTLISYTGSAADPSSMGFTGSGTASQGAMDVHFTAGSRLFFDATSLVDFTAGSFVSGTYTQSAAVTQTGSLTRSGTSGATYNRVATLPDTGTVGTKTVIIASEAEVFVINAAATANRYYQLNRPTKALTVKIRVLNAAALSHDTYIYDAAGTTVFYTILNGGAHTGSGTVTLDWDPTDTTQDAGGTWSCSSFRNTNPGPGTTEAIGETTTI